MCHPYHPSDSRTRQDGEARFTFHICLNIPSITARLRQCVTYPTIGMATRIVVPYARSLSGRQSHSPPTMPTLFMHNDLSTVSFSRIVPFKSNGSLLRLTYRFFGRFMHLVSIG